MAVERQAKPNPAERERQPSAEHALQAETPTLERDGATLRATPPRTPPPPAVQRQVLLRLQRSHSNRDLQRHLQRQLAPPQVRPAALREGQRDEEYVAGEAGASAGAPIEMMSSEPEVTTLPSVQRRTAPAGTDNTENGGPSEAQKAAALAAAARANAVAAQALGGAKESISSTRSASTAEKAAGQAAQQEARATTAEAPAAEAVPATAEAGQAAPAAEVGQAAEAAPAAEAGQAAPAAAGAGSGSATATSVGVVTAGPSAVAPATPAEDPGFQAVVTAIKGVAGGQKAHPSAAGKAREAQAAAEMPAAEQAGQAQANQVGVMEQVETPAFDREGFKQRLMDRIAAMAPQTAQQADEFKENNQLDSVKGDLQGQVAEAQEASQGPLEVASTAGPDPSSVEPKPVTPLQASTPGASPPAIAAEQAVPQPRGTGEVEAPLQESSQTIDAHMADADVTDEQLEHSNEPEFQKALGAKHEAREHARNAPQSFRQAEQEQLSSAQNAAVATTQEQTQGMHGERAQLLTQVGMRQSGAKSSDEQERTRIAGEIQAIYAETKATVESKLAGLDGTVAAAFDEGAAGAKQSFEGYVDAKMDAYTEERYGGWLGWAQWIEDKVRGMPPEVNRFYEQGRDIYLKKMDAVIDRVVSIIERGLTEAKAEIARGKQRIQQYVAGQPAHLQQIAQQSAQDIQSQFDTLEQQVDAKQDELIDTLANKYQENLQAVDARIEELKAANQGLVDKAINAVAGAIKTILELKNLLTGVLAQAGDAIGLIIKDPIGFLGNMISGVKQGFLNFVANIGTHLKEGLMSWLFGEVAKSGIEMPRSFDLKGILTLVMQVLGLTWDNMRRQAVKILGESVVGHLEQAFDIFVMIKNEGIGGLWEFIKDKLADLKDMVIGGIQEMITNQVIQAGIQWLIGILGGPAGAFIKAAKAIYDIVMWFVNNASRMASLIQSILGSVSAIARGALGEAAQFIEQSLAKAIPTVIGFLASLLGLGNLGDKIREIIQKFQAPINKAIGWVLGKAKGFAKKVMGKVRGIGSRVRDKLDGSEEDKQKRLVAGVNAGVAAVNTMKGRSVTAALIKPALAALKLRYRLGVLEPVVKDGYWAVHGDVRRAYTAKTLAPSRIGTGKTKSGQSRTTKEWRERYGPNAMREHHLIPQALLKDIRFTQRLKDLGVSNPKGFIDRKIVMLTQAEHSAAHDSGWNSDWKSWLNSNLHFSLPDLESQIKLLMNKYLIPKSSRQFVKSYGRNR